MIDTDRTKPLSRTEFDALPRYGQTGASLPCGRIVDLPAVFHLLTPPQVCDLDSDDWEYYNELDEEVRVMFEQFKAMEL